MVKKSTVIPKVEEVIPEVIEPAKLYEVRLYMKSGNIIELNNLLEFSIDITTPVRGMNWRHAEFHAGYKLMGSGIDMDQIECATYRDQ